MIQRISILLLIILPFISKGQVLSSKGRFSVEFDKGCNPMTVNITELDSFGDITRQYFFEENTNITNNKTYTYTSSSTYEIVQVIGVDNQGSKFDTLQIEVFDSFEPKINIEKCSGNEISITSEENTYDFIRVYFGGADSVQISNGSTSSFTYASSILQAIGIKGFFTNADNKCSNYFEEVLPIPALSTPTISSLAIKESCKDVFTMYLELDSYDSLITYQVELNQTSSTILFEGKLLTEQLIFSDIPFLKSQTDYCVQVNAVDPCNASRVEGTEICQQSSNLSLSPFESLYSTYQGNGILINLDSVSSGSFNVFRRRKGETTFQKEDSVTATYTDVIGSNSRKYFYKIDYQDSCNQILFSAETNPPFIESTKISKNSYTIDYQYPSQLNNGIYFLEAISGNAENSSTEQYRIVKSATQNSFSFNLKLNAKDGTSVQKITTKLYSTSGELLRQSNSINLKFDIEIYVPTAFTPNNDGLNDTLELFGLPSSEVSIKIYSKWGQLIYASDEPVPGWDGTIAGELAPEGTYLYEIIFESTQGEKLRQKGTFALITK